MKRPLCHSHSVLLPVLPCLIAVISLASGGNAVETLSAEMGEPDADLGLPEGLEIESADDFIEEVLEDSTPPEPDYPQVISDALKIAEEIDRRFIEQRMGEASEKLSVPLPVEGYPKAREAYQQMEEMISFCKAGAGAAGKACRFKLKMQMNLDPGRTLSQFSKGLPSGSGSGAGFGLAGQGAAGISGGQSQFALFGPDQFGRKSSQSRRLGDKKNADSRLMKDQGDPLAGNVEEISTGKDSEIEMNAEGEAGIMEEYRGLITEYFKQIAEEEK